MAKHSVVWHGKRRYLRRLQRLYVEEQMSTYAIADLETHRIGKTVQPYQVYNALKKGHVPTRSLSEAMQLASEPPYLPATLRRK